MGTARLTADDGARPGTAVLISEGAVEHVDDFLPAVLVNSGQLEPCVPLDDRHVEVRIEPQDQLPWRFFDARWIAEQTPEMAETWQTQFTTHGQLGFMHVRQVSIMYAATQPVTLTISVYDGTAPAPIALPATGSAVKKIVFVPTFNKGQLYAYKFSSAAPFQVYQERSETLIGRWGRADAYSNVPLVGGNEGDKAAV